MKNTLKLALARAGRFSAALFAACGATAVLAQDFQFRVNASDPLPGIVFLHPPTIGMVRSGTGGGGNVPDAMALSWSGEGLEAIPLPVCVLDCDGFEDLEVFGSGDHAAVEKLFVRRFDNHGAPIDADDVVISQTTMPPNETHGGFFTPSLAISPGGGFTGFNPMQLAWWEMWRFTFLGQGPCGTISCSNQPVGSWEVHWSNFLTPMHSSGSTAFGFPIHCRAQRPSAAYANPASRLVAWRDIDGPCRRILASLESAGANVVVRDPAPGFNVDRPCADAVPSGNSYVVAWREDNLTTSQSAIYARRVFAGGTLGLVTLVENFGSVESTSGPAVCVFHDGSFAVQWVASSRPGTQPLRIQRYTLAEPPVPFGGVVEVEEFVGSTKHTIACLGTGVGNAANPTIHLASVYEFRRTVPAPLNIHARAIDSATGQVGDRTLVPIALSEPGDNLLGEPHQHTALLRSDQRIAVAWHRNHDNHNYCTVRTLTLGCVGGGGCDSIDFNNDGVSPDSLDIDDFLSVFAGGACSNDPVCNDIDFNNDCVSPDSEDIDALLRVFGGGSC